MLNPIKVIKVVKNADSDIFSLFYSCLMYVFSPNVGHQEKNNIQILNYNYSFLRRYQSKEQKNAKPQDVEKSPTIVQPAPLLEVK